MSEVLEVKHLTVKVEKRILIHNLSFRIMAGTLTWVTGENGVGKTTLMKTLLRNIHNRPVVNFKVPAQRVQYVPQFRNINSDFPLVTKDFVALSLQQGWTPWLTKKEKICLHQILRATRLTKIANEPLGEASGGEQQRAFLAQALVTNPQLLILDETTASLDTRGKISLLQLVVQAIRKHHLAVMFITHDPELMQRFGGYELQIVHQHGTMKKLGGTL